MVNKEPTKIKSLQHLINLIKENNYEFFIVLAGGFIKSSKIIDYDTKDRTFYITNEVDNTHQILTHREIFNKKITNIGKAIELECLYMYNN